MSSVLRAARIGRILLRYRLDSLAEDTPYEKWLAMARPFVPRASEEIAQLSRGARLRLALQELGPIFVKFGQILSTRRDLIPVDIADELAFLQDRVKPFDGELARTQVEAALGKPIDQLYARFDLQPLGSASISQVHGAQLFSGREVVVKVIRPNIGKQISEDLSLLYALASVVERTHPASDKIRPREVVDEIAATLTAELDMQREGSNASLLRRNWEGSDDLYVPEVIWSHTAEQVLTLERVYGIPSDDVAALDAAGINRVRLAEKGVRVFYEQVFRDNFFHADAHAGNIWVDQDPARKDNPRFIALDFGIMGQLSDDDQYYLAENFMAIFNRDYRRIAELHVRAGWMPADLRIDELEAAVRAVCEPYLTRPLSEISLAELLAKLFRTAQKYQLTLQPQLILLQKTLLSIEGVGRTLDPRLDIWEIARPVLQRILVRKYSPSQLLRELRKRMPEIMTTAPEMPRLAHQWLSQQAHGQQRMIIASTDLEQMRRAIHDAHRQTVAAVLGAGLLIVASVLYVLEAGGPKVLSVPLSAWIAGAGGVWALLAAWPRRRR